MKTGIQLYTVREPLQQDFEGTIQKLADMGYAGAELAFYYGGMEPSGLARLFGSTGMAVCGIYENFHSLPDPGNKVYEYAAALDCRYLTSGLGIEELRHEFDGCVSLIRAACDAAAGHGIKICYHAHAHEFEKADGNVSYMDRLLGEIPEIAFEADTAWIRLGGENVQGYLEKHASRIPLIHVKDVTADGRITELGRGVIDFKPVIDFARRMKIEWINYEQDTSELTPMESAAISIAHLESLI